MYYDKKQLCVIMQMNVCYSHKHIFFSYVQKIFESILLEDRLWKTWVRRYWDFIGKIPNSNLILIEAIT